MCEDSADAAAVAAQREEGRELLSKLASSNAQRAVLREEFYAALRRLEQLSDGARR